jgi:hypothetical protein
MKEGQSTEMSYSLESLNAVKASEVPFEFQVEGPDGEPTPIFISVYGAHSEKVTRAVSELVNERRRKAAIREASGRKKNVEFDTLESDVDFGKRLAAVRIAKWRGISEPCTPENALKLCQINHLIAAQVTRQSDDLGNFMRL